MQICPNCGHKNSVLLYFCEKCARALGDLGGERTIPILKPSLHKRVGDEVHGDSGLLQQQHVMLYIDGAPEPVVLPEGRQVILGRTSAGYFDKPDLDLARFGALDRGVSRAHAALYRQKSRLTIVDMDSINGTYLNGERLIPGQPCIVRDGDEIYLAQMAIKIRFERTPAAR